MRTATQSEIRSMVEDDLVAVLAIEQLSFSTPWKREHFVHELGARHSFPFVALCDGSVVGYVCLMSLFEEAQILDIAVAPALRGLGVARDLLEYATDVARQQGAELLALEVCSTNGAAIALYERNGFVRTGLRQKYYDGRDDAVLMEKNVR